MNVQSGFERCQAFINCQMQPAGSADSPAKAGRRWRAVTISRQAGAGAHAVAARLAEYLQAAGGRDAKPWLVFDRNLTGKVLEEHDLPANLAKFMPEDRVSAIADTMEEFFGLHPPTWILVRETADTILHLAELGNVILIGRGANVVTSKLAHVFHVRLVGSLEKRIANVQANRQLTKDAALEFIRREDAGRRRYLKTYFHKNIDDPLLYHLIINTDSISPAKAAEIIGDAVLSGLVNTSAPHTLGVFPSST